MVLKEIPCDNSATAAAPHLVAPDGTETRSEMEPHRPVSQQHHPRVADHERKKIIVVELLQRYAFDEAVWRYLVREKRVELNLIDEFGDSPLTLAIKLHRQEVIQQLLSCNRVKVDLVSDRRPPFHLYCEEGFLSLHLFNQFMVRLILLSKEELLLTNYEGKTALHCLLGNQAGIESPSFLVPFIQKLREAEPQLLIRADAVGETPLMTAISRGFPFELLQHLIPGSSDGVNLTSQQGLNALALAILRFQGDSTHADGYAASAALLANEADRETDRLHSGRWRWDHQLQHQQQQQQSHHHAYGGGSSSRRNSWNRSPRPQEGKTSRRTSFGAKTSREEATGPLERDLHSLIHVVSCHILKQDHASTGLPATSLHSVRQSLLSFVVHNKKVTHRTMRLLLQKGLISGVLASDIRECVIEFRLDLLSEMLAFASESRSEQMSHAIMSCDGLPINLLDHVYSFRHIYSLIRQEQQLDASSSHLQQPQQQLQQQQPCSPGGEGKARGWRESASMRVSPLEDCLSPISRSLARHNLSRIKELLAQLFDSFGHDINHVITQTDPHTKREVESFTLIHALIQANSWVEMPDVVDYILRDKGRELMINVSLPGRGTPLNYAIRLGQFDLANAILNLNPDISQIDLSIPVLPLKRNFSEVMRRLLRMGVQIPREFATQNIRCGIEDARLEVEFYDFMAEARRAQRPLASAALKRRQ